ncbi:D-amino-acid dehydrogenase [Oceanospirillum multiglobuliferum]|uniref:D-amino acid dehydrogenase n=1 Tax=Oceanospirillum multiglobuliferum TaxID=64969 RepID=A0A1T4SBE0_9GAMM|nr:D-amino acid dehydrogenase [Oceanospirillum multiglobuliferum]OPX55025.1 D-amino acid dehydrogenase small subunit [Oceanospirillum multiglobuliferum]SKA25497.1 D-amino-acid dehydrogenase [Oceanospirillum multiglobuliferum]
MNILILGSGVVGVTSAYYLAKQGHQVTVIDRQASPAMETSHANAGQVSFGYSSPWAAPGIPLKAMKWLTQTHAPLKLALTADPHQWTWMTKMLANCTEARYAVNKARMVRVSEYSRISIDALRAETGISYEDRQQGTLQMFRSQKQVDAVGKDIEVLKQFGMKYEELDMAGCIAAEPALARVKDKFVGGLRLADDQTGDCYTFTNKLAKICEEMGVKFLFETEIEGLTDNAGKITGVKTRQGTLTADHYVVAMGSFSRQLLKQVGIDAPIYPVKGYSLTVPITNYDAAPVSTVMDETYKVAITRFDDRIRVAGTAELSGYNLDLPAKRRATIAMVVSDVFPEGGDVAKAEFWTGLRPMTPDGTPLIGKTKFDNLSLNTGHGTLGWTMSCGSARLLADLISGNKPEIDPKGLDISRYN